MTADTVLLVTASYDEAPNYVGAALEKKGVPFFRLDTDMFPASVKATFDPRNGVEFVVGSTSLKGNRIKSVWYRRNVAPELPSDLEPGIREFCERETRSFLNGVLSALDTKRWLSHPLAIAGAERKLLQLKIAHELGFIIPDTVVSNDAEPLLDLASRSQVVTKAVSSGYIRTSVGNNAIFTSLVGSADLANLTGLDLAPVLFQRFIEKVADIRVTVVEADVYAAEILSQADESSRIDWRATTNPSIEHRRHSLPIEMANRCRALVERLGLHFGAIDLALDKQGQYTFFEINPNGEWMWIEDQLGFPISDRLAAWLDCQVA